MVGEGRGGGRKGENDGKRKRGKRKVSGKVKARGEESRQQHFVRAALCRLQFSQVSDGLFSLFYFFSVRGVGIFWEFPQAAPASRVGREEPRRAATTARPRLSLQAVKRAANAPVTVMDDEAALLIDLF